MYSVCLEKLQNNLYIHLYMHIITFEFVRHKSYGNPENFITCELRSCLYLTLSISLRELLSEKTPLLDHEYYKIYL